MIPGTTSKLSEEIIASTTSIAPKSDLAVVTGTTAIATIMPPYEGFSGILVIVPKDGNVATVTTGNIATAVTMPQARATVLVWSKSQQKWYPGAIS